jgi:hypothetical protein
MWPDMRITILDYRRRVTRMRIASERLFMKLIKGSLAGLVLAGILAIAPTAAFAHDGWYEGHYGYGRHYGYEHRHEYRGRDWYGGGHRVGTDIPIGMVIRTTATKTTVTSRYSRVNTQAGDLSLVAFRLFPNACAKGRRGRIHSGSWIMEAPKS